MPTIDENTDATPTPSSPAPEIFLTPIDWYRAKSTKWPLVCLASAMQGWDPRCDDEATISGASFDAAIAAAEAKLEECRAIASGLPDSTSARRVFILCLDDMHAIVAYKPSVAEASSLLRQLNDAESPPELRQAQITEGLWSRVLWPASASPERQAIMDQLPIAFGNSYPIAYMKSIGLSSGDVRKKR